MMIVWTALASVFAAMLGYSRIPYASARAGHFFKAFATLHPTGHFPHRSLLLIGGLAAIACLAELKTVIDALVAARIPIQFVGQIATVFYLRSKWKERPTYVSDAAFPVAGGGRAGGLALRLRARPSALVILYSVRLAGRRGGGVLDLGPWLAAAEQPSAAMVRLRPDRALSNIGIPKFGG